MYYVVVHVTVGGVGDGGDAGDAEDAGDAGDGEDALNGRSSYVEILRELIHPLLDRSSVS